MFSRVYVLVLLAVLLTMSSAVAQDPTFHNLPVPPEDDAWARALLRAGMGYTAFGDAQWRDARSLSAGSFRASDSVPSSMSSRGG